MSADLLRRAAEKLREHAKAATSGPWVVERSEEGEPLTGFVLCTQAPVEYGYQRRITSVLTPDDEWPDLDYFALMHPPVALALADWLELLADCAADGFALTPEHAERVARAVLREPGTPEGGTD